MSTYVAPLLDSGALYLPLALIQDRQIDDDAIFPEGISYGASGGPTFLTRVIIASSGYEQRNSDRSRALCEWQIDSALKDPANLEILLAFVYTRFGKANGFRYKDWSDYRADNHQCSGTVGGGNKVFQLYKQYTFASRTYNRKITRPVNGTVVVTVNDVVLAEGTDWNLDYTTGLLTMTAAPIAPPYWTGEFHVPARLDTDKMVNTIEKFETFIWRTIPIVELPE